MATYSARLASGSTSGKPIPIAATATPGTLLHTCVAGDNAFDEVYLWVSNITNTAASLTVEWGGVTDPGSHLVKGYMVAANSLLVPIATGLRMNGGMVIRAFSGTASALNAVLNVNRIQ